MNGKIPLSNEDLDMTRIILISTLVPGAYLVLVASALLAILIGTGLIYGIGYVAVNYIHRVPVGIFLLMGLGMLYAIWTVFYAIYKSVIVKPSFKTAITINKRNETKLNEFVTGLCQKMGTEPPDNIILSADPEFFVTQSKIKCFDGVTRGRVLGIGMPLLGSITINEFRAILCHEFAHFTGNDTLYSKFVLPAYIGLQTASTQMQAIIDSDTNSDDTNWVGVPMLLPCWSLDKYLDVFHKLNMKISRARELRADAISSQICGSLCFAEALKKVVAVGHIFNKVVVRDIKIFLDEDKVFKNYYRYFDDYVAEQSELVKNIQVEATSAPENPYDSHPSLGTRLKNLPYTDMQYRDEQKANTLLINLDEYEKDLTEYYTALVSHGYL
ncbi:MAG: M48 family metalloprotease [Syntrophomonadaceae bacterium]